MADASGGDEPDRVKDAPVVDNPGPTAKQTEEGVSKPENDLSVPADSAEPKKLPPEEGEEFESQLEAATEQSVIVEREQWGGQCEFLMSCIASAVGLGNIWRFPLVAGQHGGGSFLIVYLIVVTIIGRPLYMLELALGQFCSNGPVKVWEMAPAFRGVGITSAVAAFFVSTFYCVIMCWAFLYLYYSMCPSFPWKTQTESYDGKSKFNASSQNFFEHAHLGLPINHTESEFWNGRGLDGLPVLNLTIALFAGWLVVWAAMVRGVSGSGKVAYFTALFPYVVLIILLGGGCSLEGASDGIQFFFTPKVENLYAPKTWFAAVGQCFFSLGVSIGMCIMLSSFNSFQHRLGRDILIICFFDTFTSILAGVCLFALIGNIAHTKMEKQKNESKTNIKDHIANLSENPGSGLAFVTFPNVLDAFGKYPGPNCFAALFFFMLITLAVGTLNGLVGTFVTVICDYFPKWKRWIVVTVSCCVCFLAGLVMVCPSGSHVLDIVDRHGSEMVIYIVAIVETIGIVLVYGLKNISNDFEFMLGGRINYFWQVCWGALPFLLVTIFAAYVITFEKKESWPNVAVGSGWVLSILCFLIIPITTIVVIRTRKRHTLMHKIKASYRPTSKWGPKDPSIRRDWRNWKKTRRTEYAITTRILKALGLRTGDEGAFLWTDDREASYNSIPSKAPSEIAVGLIVATENSTPPQATENSTQPQATENSTQPHATENSTQSQPETEQL